MERKSVPGRQEVAEKINDAIDTLQGCIDHQGYTPEYKGLCERHQKRLRRIIRELGTEALGDFTTSDPKLYERSIING